LARANGGHCRRLVAAIGDARLSVREVGALYAGYRRADAPSRAAIQAWTTPSEQTRTADKQQDKNPPGESLPSNGGPKKLSRNGRLRGVSGPERAMGDEPAPPLSAVPVGGRG
jgi:hypothetical protein